MAKKLAKAQMGKIIKGAAKAVTKAVKPVADVSKQEIKSAVSSAERARLKEKLQALSKKPGMKMGGAFDKYKSKKK